MGAMAWMWLVAAAGMALVFAKHPEKESVLVMGYPGGGSGLEWSDTEADGVVVEYRGAASVFGTTGEVVAMRVERTEEGGTGAARQDSDGGGRRSGHGQDP